MKKVKDKALPRRKAENIKSKVANPGSTLGEAIGALIEREVNRILRPIAEENGCVFVSAGRINPKSGRPTKLLLKDAAGNEYNIDSVIANHRMQPIVLIESKYIRYKKHNRDKGSWICTAHYSLRRTFPGSGLVTFGIEKRKAKYGQWRLSWLVTEYTLLRLPCAVLIAKDKRATSFITAPTERATGRVYCGSVVSARGAYRSAEAQLSST